MGYYNRPDLPFYYALADAFTVCDNYHCSVLGPTDPNRLMTFSGLDRPHRRRGGPVITTAPRDAMTGSCTGRPCPRRCSERRGELEGLQHPPAPLHAAP